ncbi:MAG: cob(I)yrinic acid a,c-diamide adenosyltransferase [Gammaproteobacteria bacterium]|nr:cob(I)yrinic acid a,c-diamide adenosyltransferase [Gammaproteobacteria bacterium]
MPKRLTRIYTRTGDDGTTGVVGDERLYKDDPLIEAIGSIDELNSAVGLLRASNTGSDIDPQLEVIQHRLFDIGGELALQVNDGLADTTVAQLEQWLDAHNASLPPLEEFVLPGGNEPAARCHLARCICRRAERNLVRLSHRAVVNPVSVHYLNRLSDLLFVVARVLARRDGGIEVTWRKGI